MLLENHPAELLKENTPVSDLLGTGAHYNIISFYTPLNVAMGGNNNAFWNVEGRRHISLSSTLCRLEHVRRAALADGCRSRVQA